MATIKFTEEGQDERKSHLNHLRETRQDIADLAGLKDTPLWGKLVRSLRKWSQFAKNEEAIANRDHDGDDIDAQTFSKRVTRFRQKQADFDFVAEILDKHTETLKGLDAEISRVEELFKAAKESLS